MKILAEISDDPKISELVAICKSDSGSMGAELRDAHRRLGSMIGKMISDDHPRDERFTVICLIRAGLCFGEGIADELDCTLIIENEKDERGSTGNSRLRCLEGGCSAYVENSTVIIADSVINSGETINRIYDDISRFAKSTIIASNVIQRDYDPGEKIVYAVRTSENKFKGSKVKIQSGDEGPDTGDRLFRTF